MLQIRLINKGSASEGAGGGKSLSVETVTVACPDHLVIADLPVAKSIGAASTASLVKIVGRRSRRHLGERVHFCVCCDFPIAIYGRLSPCEHAFCLDCARSDSSCYLCDERIQKIQTIKMMEGIFVCAAPHCLKSFLKRSDFETHIHENHADLLQPNMMKEDGNASDAFNMTRPLSTDAQPQDLVDKPKDQPPPKPSIIQPKPPPPVFDRRGSPLTRRDSDQFLDELPEFSLPPYSPQSQPPPNFVVPLNTNQALSAYNIPLYSAPHGSTGPGMSSESGQEQGSFLGFPAGGTNFSYFQAIHHVSPQPRVPPSPRHPPQFPRGNFAFCGNAGWEGQSYGWQHDD